MRSDGKKKESKLSKVIVNILTVLAVCMAILTMISVFTVDKTDRSLLGVRFYICLSDSMKATDFAAGDLVVSKKVDVSKIKEGDIISFVSTERASNGEIVTHKVREVQEREGLYYFTTYGTTTGDNDASLVEGANVLGKYVFSIPKVGLFFSFVKTVPGYICCVFIPFMFLIVLQIINTVSLFREYKKAETVKLKDEKAELDKQRAETERMMRELQEMKARMEAANGQNNPPNGGAI